MAHAAPFAIALAVLFPSPASAQLTTSAQLNGVGSFTMSSAPNFGGSITLEAWVNPRSHANWGRIVDIGTSANKVMLLASSATTGRPVLYVDVGGANVLNLAAASPIPLNGWSHVAGVLNADRTAQLYVNGQLVASGTASQAFSASPSVTGWVGASRNPDDVLLDASLADVRIWNTARTQAEVQAGMTLGSISGATSGLIAAYPFGATGQPGLNDVSGNNRTLVASGSVLYQTAGPASPLPGPADDVPVADLVGSAHLVMPTLPAMGAPITLEAWVFPRSIVDWGRIIEIAADGGTGASSLVLYTSGDNRGSPNFTIWSRYVSWPLYLNAPNPLPLHTWSHVAAVVDSDRSARLYVNGQVVASGTSPELPPTVGRTFNLIGKADSGNGDTAFADVRVWSAARTQAQIQAAMPVGSVTGPATSLVAAYPFGHTGQPALNDVSGNNRTLVSSGSVQFRSTGPTPPRTSSIQLNGAGSATVPELPAMTAPLTFEGWVNPRSHAPWGRVVDAGNGPANNNIVLTASSHTPGCPAFIVYSGGSAVLQLFSPEAIPLNAWSHVSGVLNADRSAQLYINGRLVASGTASSLPPSTARSSNFIGRSNWASESPFDGSIADVRIWSAGRTQSQIQSSMPVGSIAGAVTGLVAAYPFGATGQAALNDVSGNNRTLTASGNVQFQILGPSSPPAAAADATVIADLKGSGYYTLPTFPALRDFTIEAWVNPRGFQGYGRIVDLGNAGYPNDNLLLMFADNSATKPVFWVFYGTDNTFFQVTAPDPIPLNAWSHIAGTIDSSGVMRVFVNGRQVASGTAPRAANLVARSSNRIGASHDPTIFNGSIADVRIWNYARTEAQIQSTLPVGSISGPAVGLMAAYPFGSTGSEVLADISLSSRTLTQFGSPEYRKTGSGFLAAQGFQGSASLVTSAGQLTLPGNNPYTGTTTIGGGAVQVGTGGTTGSLGTGNVSNSGILTFDRSDNFTVPNAISGSGSLFKQGAGALTLSGANSFTGGLTVQAGSVALTGEIANNAANTITVNSGATFSINRHDTFGGHDKVPLTPFVIQSGGVLQNGGNFQNVLGPLTLQGGTLRPIGRHTPGWSFALRGKVTVDGGSVSSIIDGPGVALGATIVAEGTFEVLDGSATDDLLVSAALINGPAIAFPSLQASGLVKTGAGRMTLTGANAYTGTTTISAGTLQVGNGGTTGTLGTGNVVNNATLIFNRSDTLTLANAISGTGALVKQGAGTLVLSGANSYSGTSTVTEGLLQVGNGGAAGSLGSGNVVNNAGIAFNRNDVLTVPNAISGNGTVTVQGGGTVILTGANSYSGNTTLGSGTLQVGNGGTTGSLGTGDVANQGVLILNRSDNISVANVVSGTGGLRKQGNGTATLSAANSYSGPTAVTAGTLALGASGTLGTSSSISISGGATLDVTARSGGITLSSAQSLGNPSGVAGTATLRGSINATASSATLTFDGVNPSLSVASGTLTLAGSTPVFVNITDSPLVAGVYKLIAKGAGGAVAGTAPSSVTFTGAGANGLATTLAIVDGELLMRVGTSVTVTLENLAQTYNAKPRPIGVVTTPSGIATTVTYNGGSTVPTIVGSYAVVATVSAPGFYGRASGTLVVSKGTAGVSLGNLFQNYDGTARRAVALTDPTGLAVSFTYNGKPSPPTNAGLYTVVATVNDINYLGSATGTLRVRPADPGNLGLPGPQPLPYLNHQGFLSDNNGVPLGSPNPRNYDLILRVFAAPSGGSSLWTESQNVTLDQGRYSLMLGEGQPLGVEPWPSLDSLITPEAASALYLQVTVRGIGLGGSDVVMMPRFQLLPQPYAFLTRHAVTADSLVDANGNPIVRVSGNSVGINVEAPQANLDVGGVLTASALAASGNAQVRDILTASSFVGRGTIPLGGIVIWSGVTPPSGWALCDGRTVNNRSTPDLRGRFVVGHGSGTNLTPRALGQIGGSQSQPLQQGQLPSHSHSFSPPSSDLSEAGVHSHTYQSASGPWASRPKWGGITAGVSTRPYWRDQPTEVHARHRHSASVTTETEVAGLGVRHGDLPPFYVLAYIMRVQ